MNGGSELCQGISCWLLWSRVAPYGCLIPLHFWVAHGSEKLWGKKQETQA